MSVSQALHLLGLVTTRGQIIEAELTEDGINTAFDHQLLQCLGDSIGEASMRAARAILLNRLSDRRAIIQEATSQLHEYQPADTLPEVEAIEVE